MLERLITERRAAILDAWMERILSTYPQESRRFLERKGDPFGNPMGSTFRRGAGIIVDALCGQADEKKLTAELAELVKVRAVQDMPPSRSLAFIPALRGVVRETLQANEQGGDLAGALGELDERIEGLLFQAFDLYVGCKDKMSEIRVAEEKRRSAVLLRRMERGGMSSGGGE